MSEVSADPCEAAPGQHRLHRTSHELKQLIAAVLFPAAAALEEPGLSPAVRRYLERIVWQGNWMADMIQDFLRQVQPGGMHQDARQSGTARGETVQAAIGGTDVMEVVNEAVALAALTWPGRATVESPPAPARCRLHPILLRRVIFNVLSNATRAAGPSGTVTIRIRREEDATMVSVSDSGPGFGKIPTGSGIGLAAAAGIIARYDGRIELGSDMGGGACVSLWLP